ncbi:MAG: hypothetical protein KUG79_15995 [Pseudomonadales bacterium]|nr:hypothetical protein [Pseudomonadales bacterium]
MDKRYQFNVKLTLRAPILSQASASVTLGLDTAMHRDDQQNLVLPGSLIRGNLRESWEKFADIDGAGIDKQFIAEWLGPKKDKAEKKAEEIAEANSEANSEASSEIESKIEPDTNPDVKPDARPEDYEPSRSKLDFPHWWLTENQGEAGLVHRIHIDEASGTVIPGALQVIESPWPSGEDVIFTGVIGAPLCNNDEEAERVKGWLSRGFKALSAIGALKGIGFGRVIDAKVDCADSGYSELNELPQLQWPKVKKENGETENKCVGLRLSLDRPFCIGKPAIGENNRFDSETHIPGAALIGAINQRLKSNPGRWKALHQERNNLYIRHAFPVQKGAKHRPLPILQSMAMVNREKPQLVDLTHWSEAELIDGEAPAFCADWKDKHWQQANEFCGQIEPTKRLDIRTAIEEGSAKESQLFAMETVQTKDHEWLTNIDLSQVNKASRVAVISDLREVLSQELWPLSKTKASASVAIDEKFDLHQPSDTALLKDGIAIISLITPALLLTSDLVCPATNGGKALAQAYARAWHELSDGSLALTQHFTHERLYGGRYWWGRFSRNASEQPWGEYYQPQILTEAGSVFVLSLNDDCEKQAIEKLHDWQHLGLPPRKTHPQNWQHNPWLNNNGYGEIAINLDLHWTLNPQAQGRG